MSTTITVDLTVIYFERLPRQATSWGKQAMKDPYCFEIKLYIPGSLRFFKVDGQLNKFCLLGVYFRKCWLKSNELLGNNYSVLIHTVFAAKL